MDSKDYTNLLGAMKDGTCAIILGPEFYLMNNGEEAKIKSHSDAIHDDCLKSSKYLVEDGFFYSDENDDTEETYILRNIARYYGALPVPMYYDLLAELPFYLVISLSPDDLLSKAMISKNRKHSCIYFKKGSGLYEKRMEFDDWVHIKELQSIPTANGPLIFNFQGIHQDFQSLIFTYDSLFNFLYSIFPATNLPDNLRAELSKASSFLFLGFGYERWYLKIIFFILQKLTYEGKREKKAIFNFSHRHNKMVEFYKNKFQLKFFKESTIDFISTLHKDCKDAKILQPKTVIPPPQKSASRPYKILYFSSNPYNLNPLDFESEFKIINESLKVKRNKNDFEEPKWFPGVTQNEMLNAINEEKPNLIVISMHGSQKKGLLFKGSNGGEEPFALDDFVSNLRILTQNPRNSLECIVFNCCQTMSFAEASVAYLPFCIGIEGAIQDEALPVFLEGFINTLYDDRLVNQAYNTGVARVSKDSNLESNAQCFRIFSKTRTQVPANLEI